MSATQDFIDEVKGCLTPNVNSALIELKNQDDILKSRIDNLSTLEEGSTTGDAELIDTRVGADGTIYPNAGTAVRTQVSELKEDLELLNKPMRDIVWIDNCYFDTTSHTVKSTDGWSTSEKVDCKHGEYLFIVVSKPLDGKYNGFFDDQGNYISSFTIKSNTLSIIDIPQNASYFITSLKSDVKPYITYSVYKKRGNKHDVLIASSNSKNKEFADLVCRGEDDQYLINKIMENDIFDTIFFCGDSEFTLSAPIYVTSSKSIESNGAIFTSINMCITSTTSVKAANVTEGDLYLDSLDGIKYGAYLYIADDSKADCLYVEYVDISKGKIGFKSRYSTRFEVGTPVKTASPCFVIRNTDSVVIKGIVIDWNVDNNPIQTFNPYYLQEGICIDNSSKILIENCKIINGARRGITTYNCEEITIRNCYFENWKEHGIDIFVNYENISNPKEVYCFIDNVISVNNAMCGIQCHRGSGVVITNCKLSGNKYGVRNQEYAHHNVIKGCIIENNSYNGIFISDNSNNVVISENLIKGNDGCGVLVHSSDNVSVCNNNISESGNAGIKLSDANQCIVLGNNMDNNNMLAGEVGSVQHTSSISITATSKSELNNISCNNIHQSNYHSHYGVGESELSDKNVIINNLVYGMRKSEITTVGSNTKTVNNYIF